MIPPMVEIARDVASLCPDALFINYANPMSVICRAIRRETKAKVVDLRIGVEMIHNQRARFIGADPQEVRSAAVGVNHLTWFADLR